MFDLIIAEKPKAAQKIAQALAESSVKKEKIHGVDYFRIKRHSRELVIVPALGHLYTLAQKDKTGWNYPVFETVWKPAYEVRKDAKKTKAFIAAIERLGKKADKIIVACDYDSEGEVIGLNVVRYACKRKDAERMKFSTLTKDELIDAYEGRSPHLDWGQAMAGQARHQLDWLWGINISRALTIALKSSGVFKVLSAGRVQGPALNIVVKREKEIASFKPVPYWQLFVYASKDGAVIEAEHVNGRFLKKQVIDSLYKRLKGVKKAVVKDVKEYDVWVAPPPPFDLTTLQTEAYKCFGMSPRKTLLIAQELYMDGLISYPRTSSQKLPSKIGYKKILKALEKQKTYSEIVKSILKKKSIKPVEGKKTDPAHPAIFVTGSMPKKLSPAAKKLYDLIARRFLAAFCAKALRIKAVVELELDGEVFRAQAMFTKSPGWYSAYEPFIKIKESTLPRLSKGDVLRVSRLKLLEKETQPPKRYTEASLVKELEQRGLGTKATRAAIVGTLFQRGYIVERAIRPTKLGMFMIEILKKYCPAILDEKLTKKFEHSMELIRESKAKLSDIIEEAKKVLSQILKQFKKKEEAIGKALHRIYKEQKKAEEVSACPVCKKGRLVIRKGAFGRFLACSRYPECSATFKMPKSGRIVDVKECEECGFPKLTIVGYKKQKGRLQLCINQECPSKDVKIDIGIKNCPKCKKGNLVVKKSLYGAFLACERYPACKYTERIK